MCVYCKHMAPNSNYSIQADNKKVLWLFKIGHAKVLFFRSRRRLVLVWKKKS